MKPSGKPTYPSIKITFRLRDFPLAEKIVDLLGCNRNSLSEVPNKNGNPYYLLHLQDAPSVYKIALLLNGNMRTPKVEAHHRLVD